jgi:hypothetical protein
MLILLIFEYWKAKNITENQNGYGYDILFQSAYPYANILVAIGLAFIVVAVVLKFYVNKNREKLVLKHLEVGS